MHIKCNDYDKAIKSLLKVIKYYEGSRISEMYKKTLEDVKKAKEDESNRR